MTSRLIGPTAAATVKPRTKPRSASAGSTGSPFGDEKTPSASAAGASRAGGRRPSGARGQVEVARMGTCWDVVLRRVAYITAEGARWALCLSTAPPRPGRPSTHRRQDRAETAANPILGAIRRLLDDEPVPTALSFHFRAVFV